MTDITFASYGSLWKEEVTMVWLVTPVRHVKNELLSKLIILTGIEKLNDPFVFQGTNSSCTSSDFFKIKWEWILFVIYLRSNCNNALVVLSSISLSVSSFVRVSVGLSF